MSMEIVALFVAAFLQLASLSLDQLRDTIHHITVIAEQYVDNAGAGEAGRAGGETEKGRRCDSPALRFFLRPKV